MSRKHRASKAFRTRPLGASDIVGGTFVWYNGLDIQGDIVGDLLDIRYGAGVVEPIWKIDRVSFGVVMLEFELDPLDVFVTAVREGDLLTYGKYLLWPNDDLKGGSEAPKPCTHEWVEVGFMHSKIVCKHCDREKPKS